MLAKAESPDDVRSTAEHVPVVALVETSAGVTAAPQLAGIPGVARLALGHMDLAAELGIDPADRTALLYTRSASWLPLPGGFQAPSTV
jgi:citrate lyase subunit beta/citryl-CoA lyase